MDDRSRSQTVTTTTSSFPLPSTAEVRYDKTFLRTPPGVLILAEIIFGLLVWALIAGTSYFRVSAFGWVLFVAVFYWILTVFLLIMHISMAFNKTPQIPWSTVGLCFNGSATVLYLVAAIVDAASIYHAKDHHNYNSWAASAFFAFVVTLSYAGSAYYCYKAWKSRDQGP